MPGSIIKRKGGHYGGQIWIPKICVQVCGELEDLQLEFFKENSV